MHAHGHQAGLLAVLAATGTSTPVVVSQHNAVLAGAGRAPLGAPGLVQAAVACARRAAPGDRGHQRPRGGRHGARSPRRAAGRRCRPRACPRLAAAPLRRARARLLPPRRCWPHAAYRPRAPWCSRSRASRRRRASTSSSRRPRGRPRRSGSSSVTARRELLAELADGRRPRGAGALRRAPSPTRTPWLRAADVFVLPSRWEARALVVQEAMAAGLPVVATDTGGLPDLVEGVGVLVPVGDATRARRRGRGVPARPGGAAYRLRAGAGAGHIVGRRDGDGASLARVVLRPARNDVGLNPVVEQTKHIFVTGGVASSLGKGLTPRASDICSGHAACGSRCRSSIRTSTWIRAR